MNDLTLRALVMTLLLDDVGISEEAWDKLTDYLQCQGEFELIGELSAMIKSVDGRRFI